MIDIIVACYIYNIYLNLFLVDNNIDNMVV